MPLKTTAGNHGEVAKGRGSPINPEGRFEKVRRDAVEDGWFQEPDEEPSRPRTVIAIEPVKSIITRNDSPDIGFNQSINPYRGCAHGCPYCMAGDTPILMGDGRTRPLEALQVGDEIYGTKVVRGTRVFTKTHVLAKWSVIKPAWRVALQDGTTLVAGADHRFLTEGDHWRYVAAGEEGERPLLGTANRLVGTGAFALGPSESDDYRRGYASGLLRGDGSLRTFEYAHRGQRDSRHQFRLASCDPQALLRAREFLESLGVLRQELVLAQARGSARPELGIRTSTAANFRAIRAVVAWPSAPTSGWTQGFLAGVFDAQGRFDAAGPVIESADAEVIERTCRSLDALRFEYEADESCIRLKGDLAERLRFFHTVAPAVTRKLDLESLPVENAARLGVVSVEPVGHAMRLYDITTGTEDFIANGVVAHNCYARPSHAYLGLSPGLDFETRLSAKTNAAEKLREELAKPGYRCETIVIGVNTDAYQPIEREHKVTRSILEVLHEAHHPASLITKSALVERDIDILAPMARARLVNVTLSVVTLDHQISRYLEPRASAPARRILAIKRLTEAGIPVHVNVAPVIPFLTDSELEAILEASAEAGAKSAMYTMLRLPWEVKDIFRAWLEAHFPLKAAHVMSRVHQMRGGRDNDPNFGTRMKGQGLFAELLKQRFDKACARVGLDTGHDYALDKALFVPPSRHGQGQLF